jgi:uncharacterized protein
VSPDLHSGLYACEVMHQRLHPKRHRFCYRLCWFRVDLRDLEAGHAKFSQLKVKGVQFGQHWSSAGKLGFLGYGLYADDHFPDNSGRSLRQKLAGYLAEAGIELPDDAVVQGITQARVLGYVFNPVSFWFCETADGHPLGVVAEVQNTFYEVKPFVISQCRSDGWWVGRMPKHFYVSPFLSVNDWFEFRCRWPTRQGKAQRLQIAVHTLQSNNEGTTFTPILVSTFVGNSLPLTTKTLWQATLSAPWAPAMVMAAIHWQAFRLWCKGIPFFSKQTHADKQTGLMRPHQ